MQDMMAEFVSLLEQHAPNEGRNNTLMEDVVLFRTSSACKKTHSLYEPGLAIIGQGRKVCMIGDRRFDYSAGNYLSLFLPMPLEVMMPTASPKEPILMVGFKANLHKIAALLLKLDSIDRTIVKPANPDPSGIYSAPLYPELLDATIRLLHALNDPVDAAMLGESILDEIYYRILKHERTGSLRYLLRQHEQIQLIAQAVEYIHQHIDEVIPVEELAALCNMSVTSFHRSFKEVMHITPLQYAKSIKLHHAQTLLKEGKQVNEAGYEVGYNSPAQFSREYKRQFGYSPSAT